MANIKSQIKRNRQNEKRRIRNRVMRGAARSAVKNARTQFETGDAPETRAAVMAAISLLDRAAQKGVLHLNNAARRKSRLMKRLAAIDSGAPRAQTEPKPARPPKVEPKAKAQPKTEPKPEPKADAKKKAAPKKEAEAKAPKATKTKRTAKKS